MGIFKKYRLWQPIYAAYDKWKNDNTISVSEDRKLQAIMEMVSEAGEVLGVATKARRKNIDIPREKIIDELGDTLWGVVGIMNEFDITLEELTKFNIEKLTERNS